MQVTVTNDHLAEALRFRRAKNVLGVGVDDHGQYWMEMSGASASARPLLVQVTKGKTGLMIRHRCATAQSGKVCVHVSAAVALTNSLSGLSASDGPHQVHHELLHPGIPSNPLRDLTPKCEGYPYQGSLLLPRMVSEEPPDDEPLPISKPSGEPLPDVAQNPISFSPAGLPQTLDHDAMQVAAYLEHMQIPAGLRQRVLAARRNDVPAEYRGRIPSLSNLKLFQGNHLQFALAILCLLLSRNLFAVGPKSTGKTVLMHTLAWVFGLPLWTVNGSNQTEIAHFQGDKSLAVDPATGQVRVTYVLGPVTEAMLVGGMVYIDEFSNILPGVAVWLNSIDWRRSVDVPGYGLIQAHPSFRCVFSANKGYEGCLTPNQATLDRSTIIELPYSPDVARIIQQESGCKPSLATNLADLHNDLVFLVESRRIRTDDPLSMRSLIDAAVYIMNGFPAKDALMSCILGKMWDANQKDLETVRSTISARF